MEEGGSKLSGWGFIQIGSDSAQALNAFDSHSSAPAVLARYGLEADAAVCGWI